MADEKYERAKKRVEERKIKEVMEKMNDDKGKDI